MLKNSILSIFLLFTLLHVSLFAQNYCSPTDLDLLNDEQNLIITDRTGKKLLIFNMVTEKTGQPIQLNDEPLGATCSKKSPLIYVACGMGPGKVLIIDSQSGEIKHTISAGHGLNTPILSENEDELFVCSRFDNSVKIIENGND